MSSTFTKLSEFLKSLPKWLRAVLIALFAIGAALYFLFGVTSCSTIRTTLNSNGEVNTIVKQSVLDSTHVVLSIKR